LAKWIGAAIRYKFYPRAYKKDNLSEEFEQNFILQVF
jgi:hypothetical protein